MKDGSGRTVGYPDGPIRLVSVYHKDNACVIRLERDVKPVEKSKTEKTLEEIEKSFDRIKKSIGGSEVNDYDTASGTVAPAGPKVVNYFGAVEVDKAKMTARWIRDMDERMKAQRKFVEEVKNGMK